MQLCGRASPAERAVSALSPPKRMVTGRLPAWSAVACLFEGGVACATRLIFFGAFAVMLGVLPGCSLFFGSQPSRYIEYSVVRGDTLSSIARRYSVTTDSLEDANDLDDPDELQVGQVLRIPYRGQGTRAPKPAPKAEVKPEADSARRIRLSEARKYIGRLAWPAPGARFASPFGSRWMNFHEGIDLAAPIGSPIYAAYDGVVVYSDDRIRGYGNMVVIRSPGFLHVYGHNDRNRVDAGDTVRKGERIADVGETGHATGPHLHFEIRIKNRDGKNVAIDPLVFYPRK